MAHLTTFFDGRRISTIGQPDVDAYTMKRQADDAKGSTIRRELGTLRRMLRLAYENGKLMPADPASAEGRDAAGRVFRARPLTRARKSATIRTRADSSAGRAQPLQG